MVAGNKDLLSAVLWAKMNSNPQLKKKVPPIYWVSSNGKQEKQKDVYL